MLAGLYRYYLKLRKIHYRQGLCLKGLPLIYNVGKSRITLGRDCTVKSSFLSNLVGLYSRTIILTRTPQASVHIGDRVGISGATIYARSSIAIGDDTQIGGNVKILDNDFHPIDPAARRAGIKEQIGTAPIEIGKNCFIGCNALILKGTVLGDNCVVGAGAVVAGQFEANSVIAGNPATVIRKIEKQ